jgi:putative PIN family toxin of toxin-antitoxin system
LITAVLDTNVLVSGIGWRRSIPGRILDALVAGGFVAVTSPDLLDELKRVLRYPKLARAIAGSQRLLALVEVATLVVQPSDRLAIVADEPDNRFLEAAAAAGADFLVTGDRELLALATHVGTRIVTPKEFLEALDAS